MSHIMSRHEIKECEDGAYVVLFSKPSPFTGEAYTLTLLRGPFIKVEVTYVHISVLAQFTEMLKQFGQTL